MATGERVRVRAARLAPIAARARACMRVMRFSRMRVIMRGATMSAQRYAALSDDDLRRLFDTALPTASAGARDRARYARAR